MTAFARVEGTGNGVAYVWEARSVNGRGLDIRLRLPPGNDALEAPAREALAKRLARGNVTVSLQTEKLSGAATVRLNEAVLADILRAADRISALTGGAKPEPAALLTFKGVLESADGLLEDDDVRRARDATLLQGLALLIDRLSESRRAEGMKLEAALLQQVQDIETLAGAVRASPSRTPDAIRTRLKEQIARLLDTSDTFDPDRLHQEAILVATRADVEEELQRLAAHTAAAREIMAEAGAVGRKLDFLAQEFNREANTLCSKANAVDVTRIGLSLKSVIDQFREQVQNIE